MTYYVDSNFTYTAPLYTSTRGYATIKEAQDLEESTLFLRGHIYLDSIHFVNTKHLSISSANDYSCCATMHISDNLNPAFYSLNELLSLKSITLSMGNNSGAVIVRSGAAISTEKLNIITQPIEVNLNDILPTSTIEK